LEGLEAAHDARDPDGRLLGVVHRDVSPHNVLVDVQGRVRLLDFGVAKAGGRVQTTRDGRLKGKLAYMAPEQARGRGVSPATDVYAVGVVLWEMLTGRRLFAADGEAALLEQVLVGCIDPPSRYVPELSVALDAAVRRALATQPGRRFASAREMADALRATLEGAAPCNDRVARWVEDVAGTALRERAGRMERARQRGLAEARARRVWKGGMMAAGCAAALAAAVAFAKRPAASEPGRAEQQVTSEPTPVVETRVVSAGADGDEFIELDELGTLTVDAPDAPDVGGAPAALGRRTASLSPKAAAALRRHGRADSEANCSPPYTRDSLGRKLYKNECLGR
jgi:serine/threonine-protein kinase